MTSAATTPLKICSRASILIGGSPITSFSDGTVEADVADAIYEDVVRAALTGTRWRFATKQDELAGPFQAPTARFDAAYQLPTDMLMLNAVTVNDSPILYDVYGSEVYCDAASSDTVVADYIFRPDETEWPPYFTIAVEFQVAAVMAISVARDPQMASMLEQKANILTMQARRLDSQQQTTRKLNTSRFIAQRRS